MSVFRCSAKYSVVTFFPRAFFICIILNIILPKCRRAGSQYLVPCCLSLGPTYGAATC